MKISLIYGVKDLNLFQVRDLLESKFQITFHEHDSSYYENELYFLYENHCGAQQEEIKVHKNADFEGEPLRDSCKGFQTVIFIWDEIGERLWENDMSSFEFHIIERKCFA